MKTILSGDTTKNEEHARLEAEILSYLDYIDIPVKGFNEPPVPVPERWPHLSPVALRDGLQYKWHVYVREGLARRLVKSGACYNTSGTLEIERATLKNNAKPLCPTSKVKNS